MISYDKELKIHELLDSGSSMRSVARTANVPFSTVYAIDIARRKSSTVDNGTKASICGLLLSGLSLDAVSKRLCVSREVVVAVRRTNYLHIRRVNTPTRCPACGGAVLPRPDEPYEPTEPPDKISADSARTLYRLADDVVGLSREFIVPNILFYDIARRCENAISEIGGKRESKTDPA